MSAHDELVERCNDIAIQYDGNPSTVSAFILSEVLRTLQTVTPEMRADGQAAYDSGPLTVYRTMLAASPLTPPL